MARIDFIQQAMNMALVGAPPDGISAREFWTRTLDVLRQFGELEDGITVDVLMRDCNHSEDAIVRRGPNFKGGCA